MICPRYIAEISPPAIRGALSCATQLSICLGLLASYLLGLPYEHKIEAVTIASHAVHWWRAVHIIGALISITQVQILLPLFATVETEPCSQREHSIKVEALLARLASSVLQNSHAAVNT